jgi:hypothetical protein
MHAEPVYALGVVPVVAVPGFIEYLFAIAPDVSYDVFHGLYPSFPME